MNNNRNNENNIEENKLADVISDEIQGSGAKEDNIGEIPNMQNDYDSVKASPSPTDDEKENNSYTTSNSQGYTGQQQYQNNSYDNQYYPKQVEVKSKKRIGTFTMGVGLIATGIAVSYSLFNPTFDYMLLLKFTPLLLVFLGLEVIVFSVFSKAQKLRYDFLSGFVCFLIICGSLTLGLLPTMYREFGPNRYIAEETLEDDVANLYFNEIRNISGVSDVYADVQLQPFMNDGYEDLTVDDLKSFNYVSINVNVEKKFKDEAGFVSYCKKLIDLDNIEDLGIKNIVRYLSVESYENTDVVYSMSLHEPFKRSYSKQEMMDNTYKNTPYEDDYDDSYSDIEKSETSSEIE